MELEGGKKMRGMLEERDRDERVGLGGAKPTPSPSLFSSGRANRDMRQRETMGDRQMSQSEIS